MSSSHSATTSNQDDDDEARFRAQAAALAQALRQSEASTPTTTVEDTYRQLCFDEPLVAASDCTALAKALVNETSPHALSNRLVNGVSYLVRQRKVEHNNISTTNNTNEESLVDPVQSTASSDLSSSSSGYAHLGWTVYGQLPLLILLSDHLTEAKALLGSFRAPLTTSPDDPEQVEALNKAAAQQQQQSSRALEEKLPNETPVPVADNTDMEEVWAAESDPSDFDFGATTPAERLAELDDDNAWISSFSVEPADLSKPLADTTWSHVANAVTCLLQHLNYSGCLAGLVMQQQPSSWKKMQITQKLTQLCLTLLLPSAMKSPLFREFPETHWQQLALTALHTFRDAVEQVQQRTTTAITAETSLLPLLLDEYVSLLVLLLQADHHAPSPPQKDPSSSTTTVIAPATLVGLGALSSLCQSCGLEQQQQSADVLVLRAVRETILRVADDLAHILEQQHQQATTPENTATPVVPWTFLPIWQALYAQQRHVPTLTASQAQILLQSGMVRQWMLLWQAERPTPVRTAVEQALWNLCCVSPTLIGKYVWRFGGFAAHVTAESNMEHSSNSTTSALFGWNLLGIHLAEQAGGGSGLVSLKKNKEASRPAPTASICSQQSIQTFRGMCQTIVDSLVAWKDHRDREVQDATDSEVPEETQQAFENFLGLVKSLSIPFVQHLFLEKLVQPDNDFDVITTVAPIRKILVAWPSPKSHEDSKENMFRDDTDEQKAVKEEKPSDDTQRPKRKRGRREVEDEMVAALRRSIKVLQSTLESGGSDARFSSKAD